VFPVRSRKAGDAAKVDGCITFAHTDGRWAVHYAAGTVLRDGVTATFAEAESGPIMVNKAGVVDMWYPISDVEIKPFIASDQSEWGGLVGKEVLHTDQLSITGSISSFLAQPPDTNCMHYCVRMEGKIAGMVSFKLEGEDLQPAYWIAPRFRGQGIASRAVMLGILQASGIARMLGAPVSRVVASVPGGNRQLLLLLWKRLGFKDPSAAAREKIDAMKKRDAEIAELQKGIAENPPPIQKLRMEKKLNQLQAKAQELCGGMSADDFVRVHGIEEQAIMELADGWLGRCMATLSAVELHASERRLEAMSQECLSLCLSMGVINKGQAGMKRLAEGVLAAENRLFQARVERLQNWPDAGTIKDAQAALLAARRAWERSFDGNDPCEGSEHKNSAELMENSQLQWKNKLLTRALDAVQQAIAAFEDASQAGTVNISRMVGENAQKHMSNMHKSEALFASATTLSRAEMATAVPAAPADPGIDVAALDGMSMEKLREMQSKCLKEQLPEMAEDKFKAWVAAEVKKSPKEADVIATIKEWVRVREGYSPSRLIMQQLARSAFLIGPQMEIARYNTNSMEVDVTEEGGTRTVEVKFGQAETIITRAGCDHSGRAKGPDVGTDSCLVFKDGPTGLQLQNAKVALDDAAFLITEGDVAGAAVTYGAYAD